MDGTFVKAVVEATAKPQIVTGLFGKTHFIAPAGWHDLTPKQPTVGALAVGTLTGFVDYVQANVDLLLLNMILVHVVSPDVVQLRGKLEPESQQFRRQIYLEANTGLVGKGFPFGNYLDAESFFIGLQTGFVPTPQRDQLLTLVASIKESAVRETVDDGVSRQQVTVSGGVALVGAAKVPNPVMLQPWRTFREVAQPASLFVLRLKSGKDQDKPTACLYEADGGAWRLEAVQRIATYLGGALPAGVAVIA